MTYFRKGFGLKRDIEDDLRADYHSQLVGTIREQGSFQPGSRRVLRPV